MTRRHPPRASAYRVTFNLFRGRQRRDLLCAVLQDEPVPGFLDGDAWEFAGTLTRPASMLAGPVGAQVRSGGFHLLETFPDESGTLVGASGDEPARPLADPPEVAGGALPWMRPGGSRGCGW